MRILHVVDPASPGGGGCTLRLIAEPLARIRSAEQDVLLLGTTQHAALAERCGVDVTGVITPPARQTILARRALARAVAVRENALGAYDLVHSWTLPGLLAATLALPEHRHMATFSVGPVGGLSSQLLLRVLDGLDVPLFTFSRAVEREYRSLGLPERVERGLAVLPPAVNPDSVAPTPRATLRERWEVEDDEFVVGLLSEPATWADARTAVNVAIRVAHTGRRVRLLVHHGAHRRIEAERAVRRYGRRDLMIVDDDVAQPWNVVAGLDAALLLGGEMNPTDLRELHSPLNVLTGGARRSRPMPGVLPLLWAMSAGVPVIAEASAAVRDVVEEGVTGLLVEQYDVNTACNRIVRLHDDPTIAGRIGTAARSAVHSRYHVSAYCVRLKELWQQRIAGETPYVVGNRDDTEITANTPIRQVSPVASV